MPLSLRLMLPLLVLALTSIAASLYIGLDAMSEYGSTRTVIAAVDDAHRAAEDIRSGVQTAEAEIHRLMEMTALYNVPAAWTDLETALDRMGARLDTYADLPLSSDTDRMRADLDLRLVQFREHAEILFGVRTGPVPTRDVVEAEIAILSEQARDLGNRASADMMAQVATAQANFEQGVRWSLMATVAVFILMLGAAFVFNRQTTRKIGHIAARLLAMTGGAGRTQGSGSRNEMLVLDHATTTFEMRAASLAHFQNDLGIAVERGLKGDLTHVLAEPDDPDLRAISAQTNALLRGVSNALSEVTQVLTGIAGGDLSVRMIGDYQGTFRDLAENANATAQSLAGIVDQIEASTGEITNGMASIMAGSTDLVDRTRLHTTRIEALAATSADMSIWARSARDDVDGVKDVSAKTVACVIEGDATSQETTKAITSIEEITDRINRFTDLIDDFAFQTGILAINASIEAARAGEAGRGFGIVAQEVRALAEKAGDAASQIASLVAGAVDQVAIGSRKVRALREMLAAIRANVELMDSSVKGVAEGSARQAKLLDDLSTDITEINNDMQQNDAMARQSNLAAQSASEAACELDLVTRRFRGLSETAEDPRRGWAA